MEDWRRRDSALQAEADASRSRLWDEAAERERLLAEAVGAEESRRESIEELTNNKVVFVLHREELVETLEEFARQGDKLVSVVPRRGGETISQGLKGSWLVFERKSHKLRLLREALSARSRPRNGRLQLVRARSSLRLSLVSSASALRPRFQEVVSGVLP